MFFEPIEGPVAHGKTYAFCLIGQLRMLLDPINGQDGHTKAYACCLIERFRMFFQRSGSLGLLPATGGAFKQWEFLSNGKKASKITGKSTKF
jgi:hypothetical protein